MHFRLVFEMDCMSVIQLVQLVVYSGRLVELRKEWCQRIYPSRVKAKVR